MKRILLAQYNNIIRITLNNFIDKIINGTLVIVIKFFSLFLVKIYLYFLLFNNNINKNLLKYFYSSNNIEKIQKSKLNL